MTYNYEQESLKHESLFRSFGKWGKKKRSKDIGIRLLIADHLDWSREYDYLLVLQDKINAYIVFCEEHQYNQVYKIILVEYAILEILFKYEPTIKAMNFLEQAQRQVNEL